LPEFKFKKKKNPGKKSSKLSQHIYWVRSVQQFLGYCPKTPRQDRWRLQNLSFYTLVWSPSSNSNSKNSV